jgi:hypothetical protein
MGDSQGKQWYNFFPSDWARLNWLRTKKNTGSDISQAEKHTGYYRAKILHTQSGLLQPEYIQKHKNNMSETELEKSHVEETEWLQLRQAQYHKFNYKPLVVTAPYISDLQTGFFLSVHRTEIPEEEAFTTSPPLENYIIRNLHLSSSYRRSYKVRVETGTEKEGATLVFRSTNKQFKKELQLLQSYLKKPSSRTLKQLISQSPVLSQPLGSALKDY